MSILPTDRPRIHHRTHVVPPVKPTRNRPKPPAPFAEGLDAACSCNEHYTCLSCLEREHNDRKSRIDLDRRFGPSPDELRWHAENSNIEATDFDIISEEDQDERLIAAWSKICTEPDDGPTPGEYCLF